MLQVLENLSFIALFALLGIGVAALLVAYGESTDGTFSDFIHRIY